MDTGEGGGVEYTQHSAIVWTQGRGGVEYTQHSAIVWTQGRGGVVVHTA